MVHWQEVVKALSMDLTLVAEGTGSVQLQVRSWLQVCSCLLLTNDALHLVSFIVCTVTCRVSGTGNGVVVSEHQHLFCHLFIEIIMFHLLIPSVPVLTS